MKRNPDHYQLIISDPGQACDLLAGASHLPKARIKDAMNKGAVWLQTGTGRARRLRRASHGVRPGDRLDLYYDPELLARIPPTAVCLQDMVRYSVWDKPAGLLAQGSRAGDHCSLPRQAELHFSPRRQVFVVHRIDREATGLMLLAHDQQAAAKLSRLFQERQIDKRYWVSLLGNLRTLGDRGVIDVPLDGKAAHSEYTIRAYDAEHNTSEAEVMITTGRRHQIRRHFAELGFPVMGDPRYGTGNKNTNGLQLKAVSLAFRCPFSGRHLQFALEK